MSRLQKYKVFHILVFVILSAWVYYAYGGDLPKWFPFNKESALEEWQEKVFKNKVLYTVEIERKDAYLLAKSEKACSGLFYRIRFNAEEFPMMSWQWNVVKFPEKPESTTIASGEKNGWIEKDDYAARVYVIFPSLNFRRTRSIEYIWDEDLPEGTVMTSPYFKNIKLMVIESGRKNIGKWVPERRNIYEDYKKVFGRSFSTSVGAIALMTDTDNTLSTAEALYKDIKVGGKDE